MTLKWYGEEVIAKINKDLDKKEEDICDMLVQKAKAAINQGKHPYPKTRTGKLVNSIDAEKVDGVWRWGSDLDYAKALELKGHPWLVPTNNANRRNAKNIFNRKI